MVVFGAGAKDLAKNVVNFFHFLYYLCTINRIKQYKPNPKKNESNSENYLVFPSLIAIDWRVRN